MPPKRPPSAAPSKARKKAKPIHIDFAAVSSALVSHPGQAAEFWLAEGVRQEEQGERYQFGDTARRKYSNALISYATALASGPTTAELFDATYNGARCRLHLACEFESAPSCVEMLMEAIGGFRTALDLLPPSGDQPDGREGERIDSGFNLASALVALAGMLEEGADDVGKQSVPTSNRVALLEEAATLFSTVEALQMREMARAGGEGSGPVVDAAMDSEDAAEAEEALALRLVTPSQIVETLYDSISVHLSLNALSDSTLHPGLPSTVAQALARVDHLESSIPDSQKDAGAGFQRALVALAVCTTLEPSGVQDATARLLLLAQSLGDKQLESISAYADHLVESLSPETPDPRTLLATALECYERVFRLLSSPMASKGSALAYTVPSLIANNLASRGEVMLELAHVAANEGARAKHLVQALTLYKAAIEQGTGIRLAINETSGAVSLAADKTRRTDWRTIMTAKSGILGYLRVLCRLPHSEQVSACAKGLVSIVGQLLEADGEETVQRHVGELQGSDHLWEVSTDERAMWTTLLS